MNVLVFNAGSSSPKFGFFSCVEAPRPILSGTAQNIGKPGSHLSVHDGDGSVVQERTGAEAWKMRRAKSSPCCRRAIMVGPMSFAIALCTVAPKSSIIA
jgi:hypothetical protein